MTSSLRSQRHITSDAEQWMMSLSVERAIGSANPKNPASVVSAIHFLLQMSIDLEKHGNHFESVNCAESALLLRHANKDIVEPLLEPLITEGLIERGKGIVEEVESLVLRCNSHAVNAFNAMQFDAAEYFFGKAIFLTDVHSSNETNFFAGAEARRLRLRAATLNNLGCMEKRRQRLDASLNYLRQAVELEVSLDTTSRGSPSTYLNLCTVFNETSRHHEAVNAAECAIAALEEQLPRQTKEQLPSYAMMLMVGLYNLGVSLERRARPGDDAKARASYQRALDTGRKYFVDPNCPTLELAMAAIRRMHVAPALRENKPETAVKKKTHKHFVQKIEAQQKVQPPQQQEELRAQPSSPAALASSRHSGNVSVSDAYSVQQFAAPALQQKVEQPQKLQKEEQKEEQFLLLRNEEVRRSYEEQQPRITRLTPLVATESCSAELSVQNSLGQSTDRPFPLPTPMGSFRQQTSVGASQPFPIKGPLTPIRMDTIPLAQKECEQAAKESFMTLGVAASTTGSHSIVSPAMIGGDKNQVAARSPFLAPIKQPSTVPAAQVDKQTKDFLRPAVPFNIDAKSLHKLQEQGPSFTQGSSSNPFGHPMLGNLVQRSSSSSRSTQRRLSLVEMTALEKHVKRASMRQAKVEEAKKRISGSLGRKESINALSKAKERELKRQAREEAKHDAEVAEVLYSKFVTGMRADKLARCNRAATLIQRIWRGCLARSLLSRMIGAAKKIQRVFRVFLFKLLAKRLAEKERLARLRAEQEKRELEAALVLQKRARQFLRRLEIRRAYLARKMRKYYAVRCIQRAFRAFVKWRNEHIAALIEAQRLEDERQRQIEMNAARCIQWARRRYLKRREEEAALETQKRRERAAVTIQALLRGVLARAWFRYYKAYRREQELKSAASQKRITIIQSCARVLCAARVRRAKELDLTQRFSEWQLRRAATKIQCQWRNRVARIKFERLKAECEMRNRTATRIQRWYATCVTRNKFLELCETNRRTKMATKIQCWFRECKQRIKEREMARYHANLAYKRRLARIQAQAIVFIQACWRCVISYNIVMSMRNSFLRLTLYAEDIQRLGRGYIGRSVAFKRKCAVIREARMRVEYDRWTVAACVIQRAWRCALAKDIVERMRRRVAASVCISKNYRGYLSRKELRRLREAKKLERYTCAALVIQRAARQFLKRLELVRLDKYYREKQRKKLILLRREEAATSMQAAWRGRATRMALERERKALSILSKKAVVIQRLWRAFKFRQIINNTVARRSSVRMCRNRAALTLQCFWRKMRAAEKVACMREHAQICRKKAIIIQCWWRQVLAKWELEYRRAERKEEMLLQLHYMCEWDAKVTIVNMFLRVRLAQQLLLVRKRKQLLHSLNDRERERFLSRYTAATKIQATYRGHYERVYAHHLRRQKEEEECRKLKREALERSAAIIIQCAYRSWRAICEANARRAAKRAKALEEELEHCATADPHDVVRQLFWVYEFSTKRNLVEKRLEYMSKRIRTAVKIQCKVRQWIARRRLEQLRRDVLQTQAARIIQSYWKKYCTCKMQKELDKKQRAAIFIQARFRGNSVRREWKKWHEQLAYERRYQALQDDIYDSAATVLQSCWRGIIAKRLADRMREQRQNKKEWNLLGEAASTIQRAYRRHKMFFAS